MGQLCREVIEAIYREPAAAYITSWSSYMGPIRNLLAPYMACRSSSSIMGPLGKSTCNDSWSPQMVLGVKRIIFKDTLKHEAVVARLWSQKRWLDC